ncbi:MAG: hypothetical protein SFV15_11760 [Polyangiaceae bacterium]|nr:hypothetical protein [Polyangiaceae bacterium]
MAQSQLSHRGSNLPFMRSLPLPSCVCRAFTRFLTFASLLALVGCADHAARLAKVKTALDAGRPEQALTAIDDELDVDKPAALPKDVSGEHSLLILDRSMILQQLRNYELSSRDLEVADKQIQTLDFSRNALDDVGKYMFSDDTGPYKAPAYEKLLINTINMQNYLLRGDLNGGRIEARRLAVMQKYLSQKGDPAEALLGPGSYLAGFIFEKSGRPDEALRYYDEALSYAYYRSLEPAILRLSAQSGYQTPRLRQAAERARKAGMAPAEAESTGEAELLVIVNYGRVPGKIAKRVPIGLALTYASGALSPYDQQRANTLAAQGLVTWVNFPELGRARGQYDAPEVLLDGRVVPSEQLSAVDFEVRRAWDKVKGAVVGAAITRMITRVVVGEGIRRSAKDDNIIALLLSLGTQAALTAADTPDTRSWSTLPARMSVARIRLPPGKHRITMLVRGKKEQRDITIRPGGWAAVGLTVLN